MSEHEFEQDLGDWLEATYDPEADYDVLSGADGGTMYADETAKIVMFDSDIRANLPIGHGYEDDDDPERNTTWEQQMRERNE